MCKKNSKKLKYLLNQGSARMYKDSAARYLNKYSGNYLQVLEGSKRMCKYINAKNLNRNPDKALEASILLQETLISS